MGEDIKKLKQWSEHGDQPPIRDAFLIICSGPVPEELKTQVPAGYNAMAIGAWSPDHIEARMKNDDQFAEMVRVTFQTWFNQVRGIM